MNASQLINALERFADETQIPLEQLMISSRDLNSFEIHRGTSLLTGIPIAILSVDSENSKVVRVERMLEPNEVVFTVQYIFTT